ncbi:MAG: hypothetical protein FWD73_07525 [Polyangiaceae bacterium]|nr:hypothetical protein [Polyangiaceae bacterium]
MATFELAKGAEDNAFAQMLLKLVRQNIESKPHKKKDFDRLDGTVALVADDADVAVTLEFRLGRLVVHDGILGVPDVTVRGSSDPIMTLSNVPLTRPLALPIPTDQSSFDVLRSMMRAMRTGELKVFGMIGHVGLMARLTRVMSVNG